jgi:hypothetical protein
MFSLWIMMALSILLLLIWREFFVVVVFFWEESAFFVAHDHTQHLTSSNLLFWCIRLIMFLVFGAYPIFTKVNKRSKNGLVTNTIKFLIPLVNDFKLMKKKSTNFSKIIRVQKPRSPAANKYCVV